MWKKMLVNLLAHQISPEVELVKKHLVAQGVVKTGLVGFCWGAKVRKQLMGRWLACYLAHQSSYRLKFDTLIS
jgi:dienelactone hydrolase